MSEQWSLPIDLQRRVRATRPSPALPLLLLAGVLLGGIVMSLLDSGHQGLDDNNPGRLIYWVVATLVAYAAIVLIARHQGYRHGVWVNRRVLVTAGVVALVLVVLTVVYDSDNFFLPGDLTLRGNLPLLAITVGLLIWAAHERRPGLWVVAGLLVPLALLANLYDMENILFDVGVPYFAAAAEVVNLAVVAVVLLVAAAIFALSHRHSARTADIRR